MIVRFISIDNKGSKEVVGVVNVDGNKVEITARDPEAKKYIEGLTAIGYDGKPKTIKDKEQWVEVLPANYNGTRFYAERVIAGKI